ncbi:DUF6531 domain-containing protein [Anaerorhabdus furcosa]|uniref:YD repeat-containing protein n=1 Tax=Anaerorhabdus furcosa TaxID=118967 RepID=A0A1T4PFL0_9FIRM|nr:DUF6531 domain-containing protein [Anaerorhabdus furcosa]SJZ89598.1 YD repeat-containing protein [Anaerorhabdus furcosa]
MNKKIIKWIKVGFVVSMFLSQFQMGAVAVKAELNKVQLKSTTGTAMLIPTLGNKESRIEAQETPETEIPIEPTSDPVSTPSVDSTDVPIPTSEPTPETTQIPVTTPVSTIPIETPLTEENHSFSMVLPQATLVDKDNEIIEKRTENTKTYQIDEKTFVTDVYFEPVHKEIEGQFEEIDLTLQTPPTTYSLIDQTKFAINGEGYYDIAFYRDEERLARITNEGGFSLEMKLPESNTSDIRMDGNTIQYFNVKEGIDVLYSLSSTKVKSNVLLTKPLNSNRIAEVIDIGDLEFRQEGTTIYLEKEGEVEFVIETPYLMDNVGVTSEQLTLEVIRLSSTEIEVTTIFDQNWVNAEERAFPIAIDPIITPRSNQTVDVTTSTVRSWGGMPIQMTNTPVGRTKGGDEIGIGRTIAHFVMPNIGTGMEIVSASLQMYKYEGSTTNSGINVYSRPYIDPMSTGLNFNNCLNGATLESSLSNSVLNSTGYKSFDVTKHTQDLYTGVNKTLILVAQNEDTNIEPSRFYTEGNAERPKVSITYRLAYDVNPETDINTMDARLRLFSTGLGKLDAVSIDGLAKPKSKISFDLVKLDESGNKLATTTQVSAKDDDKERLFYVDPIYKTNPRTGVQEILVEKVNYTTDYVEASTFDELDTFYTFKMKVEVGSETNTEDVYSDKFMKHEAKLGETLASLSSYYGVTVEQILLDNNTTSKVIKEGDVVLIRVPTNSPKINENDVLPPLMFEEYTAEYKYRGPVCLYGCYAGDPINTGSGNYYHENTDFTINDYKEIPFKRFYNSLGELISTSFGNGFSSNYDQFVFYDKKNNLLYFTGDGKVYEFRNNGSGFDKDLDNPYNIEIQDNKVTLTEEKTKQKIFFDETGTLTKIEELNGHFTEVIYDDYFHMTTLNIDNQKEVLFEYNTKNLVSKITLPDGSFVSYEYNDKNQMTQFMDTEGYIEKYTYDDQGRVSEIIDEDGFSLGRNTYDQKNRVISQMDGEDKIMTFAYGNKETSVTDAEGNTVIYGIDDYNRVIELRYDDGTKQINEYSQNKNQLLSITNELGEVSSYEYNEFGYVSKQVDFDGSVTLFETDKNGNITHQVYPNQTEEWSTYDGVGNKLSFTDIYGKTEFFTYDTENRMTSKTDERGNTERYTYEGNQIKTYTNKLGLTTTYIYNDLGYVTKEEDNQGRSTTYELDTKGNVLKKKDSYGAVEAYVYDGQGHVIRYTNPLGAVTESTYDSMGNVLSTTQNGLTETTIYNQQGQKVSFTDTLGNIETYEYDSKNRLVKTSDIRGNESKNVYDDAGNIIETIDQRGNSTKTIYKNGLARKTMDGYGQETSFEYDASNRIIKTIYPTGEVIQNEYNDKGQLVKTVSSKGIITESVFDEFGQVIETITNGKSVKSEYNALGQLTKSTNALGQSTSYIYDSYGNQVEVIDPKGNRTKTVYDKNNRVIETMNALGYSVKKEYDLNGNVTKEIDELGNITETTYDIYSRLIEEKDAEGYITTTKYNAKGQVSEVISARNVVTNYAYNQFGDNTTITMEGVVVSQKEIDQFGNVIREKTLDRDSTTEYNQMNQVTKTINNLTGLIEERSYTTTGNLNSVSNSAGQSTVYAYDTYNQLIQTTNAMNQVETNEYNEEGQVVRKVGFDGIETTTRYNELNQVSSTTSKGINTSYEYDEVGNKIKETRGSFSTEFDYDENNRLIKTTDALGFIDEIDYDAKGQIISKTDKNGNITSYTYDKNGNQISVTDPRGNTTSTLYDSEGNVVQVTDALGNTTTSEYNAFGQTVKTVDQLNFLVEYVYNDKQQNIQINYPYGFHHKFVYDEAGRVIEEIDSNESSKLTTYDQLGNAITKTDGNGNTTTFVYDALNRIIKEEKPNGLLVETVYDNQGNIVQQIEDGIIIEENEYNNYNQQITSINAMKQEKHIVYDVLGRISKSIDFDGIETSFVYDELGQVLTQTQNNQIITSFTYDGSGNLLTQSINGFLQKENSYDENNNIIEESKQGVTTQSTYDERNAVIEISLNGNQLYNYSYDERGYQTEVKDKDGHVASQKFDYFGNVISSTDTLGNEIKYDYDGEKNLVKVQDPSGRVVNYKVDGNNNVIEKKINDDKIATSVYDESNNLIEYTDENGFKETFAYDHQGNQIELIKPNGTVITTKYNELNQVIQITTGSDTIKKEYDLRGNLVSTTNNQGTETRVVDDLNRITEVKDVKGNRTTYQLDSFGNQTEITYAEGTVITKEYNDFNQLITIERNHELEARYTYDVNRFVDKIIQGNGVVVELETDIYGRLLKKETKSNGSLIERFKFTYDSENNLLSEEITTPTENYTNTYTYDENNELKTSSKMIDGERVEVEYNYSIFGNRIQKSKSGDVSYNYNEKNQLTSMTSKEGETKYTYDTNGNVKSKMDAAGVVTNYTYDSFNRLVKVNQGKTETTYTYDGNGNRLTESVQDTTVIHDESTNTLYKNYTVNQLKGILARKENEDTFEAMREQVLLINKNKGCKVINKKLMQEAETQNTSSMTSYVPQITTFINDVTQEYTEVLVEKSPTQTRSYSYGVSRISDGTIYYQTSRNDSVTSITNQEGKDTESYNYSDYGIADSLGFGYNGERRDITGLIYLRNRTYDATSGRFLQLDTYLGEKDSIITQNRSIAFNNNPYKYIDKGGNRAAYPGENGGVSNPPTNVCLVPPPTNKALGNILSGSVIGGTTNLLNPQNMKNQSENNLNAMLIGNFICPDTGKNKISSYSIFDQNVEKTFGKGHINNQGLLNDTIINGFSLAENGCAYISIYNLFVTKGIRKNISEIILMAAKVIFNNTIIENKGLNIYEIKSILDNFDVKTRVSKRTDWFFDLKKGHNIVSAVFLGVSAHAMYINKDGITSTIYNSIDYDTISISNSKIFSYFKDNLYNIEYNIEVN